ncbi:MAG: S24/S26 family peptidase [Oscillospiraceae bacterium]|nr:S24/S26 family peptidase [Oscillospiraceae bacterium]
MTFEEELEQHGGFLYTSKGCSMRPLIRPERDVLEISARQTSPIRKYDVVLFRNGGRFILHRVMRVYSEAGRLVYDMLGDHNTRMERGVKDEQILGTLTGLVRDGKNRMDFHSLPYRAYLLLWCRLYPIRIAVLWLINMTKALCRKCWRRG